MKLVGLTPLGVKTRDEILQAFHEPPPEFVRLAPEELSTLREIPAKVEVMVRGEQRSGEM